MDYKPQHYELSWLANRAYYQLVPAGGITIAMTIDSQGTAIVFADVRQLYAGQSVIQLDVRIRRLQAEIDALKAAREWLAAHPRKKSKITASERG
jgi:hypothetical protein